MMKTTTKDTAKGTGKKSARIPRKGPRSKSIENRDLNGQDDQTTNAYREEDWDVKRVNDVTLPSDRSVEDEEDRETKRKIADANPAEDIAN